MYCTRCEGTGYLNTDQLPEELSKLLDDLGAEETKQPIQGFTIQLSFMHIDRQSRTN